MNESKLNIQKIIDELDEVLKQEQNDVQSKISHSAPQSYNDDMGGCARGISIARQMVKNFLQKK